MTREINRSISFSRSIRNLCPGHYFLPAVILAFLLPHSGNASELTSTHWAFQKVAKPDLPEIKQLDWATNPIDLFVARNLEDRDMTPSPRAEPQNLLRRISYNLTGLPPDVDEIDENLRGKFTQFRYSEIVDHFLASPTYGEKWARNWLDLARYADSKGYVFTAERRFPYSYTYRDYSINAFNSDKPYNDFIIEQLAADGYHPKSHPQSLAAMGFLTVGRRFLNNPHDIIDDRIDVVTRGFLGLTVTCARCHDHKYDPISMDDYYSLYGVFASSVEPGELPLIGTSTSAREYANYQKEKKQKETELKEYRTDKSSEFLNLHRSRSGEYLRLTLEAEKLTTPSSIENLVRKQKLDPKLFGRWVSYLEKFSQSQDSVFSPWFELKRVAIDGRIDSDSIQAKLEAWKTDSFVNRRILAALGQTPLPESMEQIAERYGNVFQRVNEKFVKLSSPDADSSLSPLEAEQEPSRPTSSEDEVFHLILHEKGPYSGLSDADINRLFDIPSRNKLRNLEKEIRKLEVVHPGAPPRGMVLYDRETPKNANIFHRGNPNNRGKEVPRKFLTALTKPENPPFSQGSGRLELAKAIASDENPLTARVLVNRIWGLHFGRPLVDSPSDFGFRAERPLQLNLLNYLAAYLMENDWSIKRLQRLILTSATFQQSSQERPVYMESDPENRLLWKMNRKRLDFEATRDSLLVVSGSLDRTVGGRSQELTHPETARRRTLYGFIDRQNLPGLYRAFDFANPDAHQPKRHVTTVPQQALFLMNSPFASIQAERCIQSLDSEQLASDSEKVISLYRMILKRSPEQFEISMGMDLVMIRLEKNTQNEKSNQKINNWSLLAHTLLLTNEFAFLD
ncbi:MAG TPA: DUF1553 domain-containing protein [Verrucomicrobiales bacterium]|nr:DUF1553 domain-containing protein [Verrucomicrobiales bacterium]